MVKLKNGILAAPKKGPAPMPPPNYRVDPNDPYVFYPIIPECSKRLCIMIHDQKCRCDTPAYFCGKERRIEKYPDCFNCKDVQ